MTRIFPYALSEETNEFDPLALEDEGSAWFEKAHDDDAAFDLRAAEETIIRPGQVALVGTGLRIAIPEGHAGLVLPRSGLALHHGITVLNAPGLIDPGYRGEIGVVLHKVCSPNDHPTLNSFHIEPGARIAQLLLVKTADLIPLYVSNDHFGQLESAGGRGQGGFGSTGR